MRWLGGRSSATDCDRWLLGRVTVSPNFFRSSMQVRAGTNKDFADTLFFLSPRRRSGKRIEERAIQSCREKRTSSPEPSPQCGGEGVTAASPLHVSVVRTPLRDVRWIGFS